MPSLIQKLFHKSNAPNDGLTQPQREAIVDLLNYCMYADNLVMLAEDRLIADTVAKFNWDPKAVPFDQFDARSVGNARNARESQVYRDKFLGSISDRLSTDAIKAQALDLCQELFLADGAQSDEEDAVLQSEAAARIEVVIPAVEAGLQRGTLIKQHAESFGNLKSEIIHPTSCSKTRTTSSEPAQWSGRAAEEPQSAISNQSPAERDSPCFDLANLSER